MTEQERQDEIEKAARGIAERRQCMMLERTGRLLPHWITQAEAALEAVGYFDMRAKLDALVEAGEGGRLCVACGRTLPASHDRTKPGLGCKSPDACTIDMTLDEAFLFWRQRSHDLRACLEDILNRACLAPGGTITLDFGTRSSIRTALNQAKEQSHD